MKTPDATKFPLPHAPPAPRCASCGHLTDDHHEGGTGACGVGDSGVSRSPRCPCLQNVKES